MNSRPRWPYLESILSKATRRQWNECQCKKKPKECKENKICIRDDDCGEVGFCEDDRTAHWHAKYVSQSIITVKQEHFSFSEVEIL